MSSSSVLSFSIKCVIDDIIIPNVIKVQQKLLAEYGKSDDTIDTFDFAGLCNIASSMIKDDVEEYVDKCSIYDRGDIEVTIIHGEQKHTPGLRHISWGVEHTWNKIYVFGTPVYVDATIKQFSDFYPDLPQYYVSIEKPK